MCENCIIHDRVQAQKRAMTSHGSAAALLALCFSQIRTKTGSGPEKIPATNHFHWGSLPPLQLPQLLLLPLNNEVLESCLFCMSIHYNSENSNRPGRDISGGSARHYGTHPCEGRDQSEPGGEGNTILEEYS